MCPEAQCSPLVVFLVAFSFLNSFFTLIHPDQSQMQAAMPLTFEVNRGQAGSEFQYLARRSEGILFLT
jgi:hypothetical protein